MRFVDCDGMGLTLTEANGIDGTHIVGMRERLSVLRRLRTGAGVRVVTGPRGVAFWMPVSVEVRINVEPDDYELEERCEPGMAWALEAVGVTQTVARGLARRYVSKEPTKALNAAHLAKWHEAKALVAAYEATEVGPSIVVEASHIEAVIDPAEQLALLDRLDDVALDWEWNIDPAYPRHEPEALGVATHDRTWYFPVYALDYAAPSGHGQALRERVARTVLRTRTTWHNAKADFGTQWPGDPLEAHGSATDDTLVMAFVAGLHELALKPLVRSELGRDPLDYPGAMRQLSLDVGVRYGGADARNTYDLREKLRARLSEREQTHIYEKIERPLIPLLTSMERYGHTVDPARARELRDGFAAMEDGLRGRFWFEEHLDISKDASIRELVRRRMGYDPGGVAKDALAKIPGDWMDGVMAYRQLRHQRRSFLEKIVAFGEQYPGAEVRMHTNFTQAGREDRFESRSFKSAPRSGRLSSGGGGWSVVGTEVWQDDKINLMNQPRSIRSVFTAPPGMRPFKFDYDQLELKIGAGISRDPAMLADLAGGDMHTAFQLRAQEITGRKLDRPAAKQFNFSGNYGGGVAMARTILQRERFFIPDDVLAMLDEARKMAYAEYYTYGDRVERFARMNGGYSETVYGRRRYDLDLFYALQTASGHAARALLNHTIQGTAADMLKIAMRLAVPVLRKHGAHLSIQVHDELVGWVPDEADHTTFVTDMKGALQSITWGGMMFTVSGGVGTTWEDAK